MRGRLKESFFYRLLGHFLTFALVVLAVCGGVSYLAFSRVYSEDLMRKSQSGAAMVAGFLETALDDYQSAVCQLSQSASVEAFLQGDPSESTTALVQQEMYQLKNRFTWPAVVTILRSEDASTLSTGSVSHTLYDGNYASWGAFRKANESDEPVVYTVSRDAILDENTRICVMLACRDADGAIIGYLFTEVPRATLTKMFSEYPDEYNNELLLVNRQGSVLFHSLGVGDEGLGKMDRTMLPDSLWEGSESGEAGDGAWAYSLVHGLDAMVLVETSQRMVKQMGNIVGGAVGISLLIGLPFSFGMAYAVAQSVSRPVRRLRESMAKVREGDLTARVEISGTDEISRLGETFNDMTAQIQLLVQRIEEKQEHLRIAEAKALSLQVNPHFIYNTLELIHWAAQLNKPEVVTGITVNFGRLLRRSMNQKEDLVSIGYELETIEAYVNIQKYRYGDRLQVEISIPEPLRQEQIPKLLLQPLVENAIVHGLEHKPGQGLIRLSAEDCGDYIRFHITDNGVGMSEETLEKVRLMKSNGMFNIGLNNVHQRALVYGDESCGLEISSSLGNGTEIQLTVRKNRLPSAHADD